MIILAHRGLWRHSAERNSIGALTEALNRGYGVETDIRDYLGRLVISHDPPTGDDLLYVDDFLDVYGRCGRQSVLALNIKSDGLQDGLRRAVDGRGIGGDRYFVFDMAVPDALGYLRRGIPCFTRESEFESVPPFLDRAAGVWMDCFDRDWVDAEAVSCHLKARRRVALVSPELHGREYNSVWARWKAFYRQVKSGGDGDRVLLCTDHPEQARKFFDEQD